MPILPKPLKNVFGGSFNPDEAVTSPTDGHFEGRASIDGDGPGHRIARRQSILSDDANASGNKRRASMAHELESEAHQVFRRHVAGNMPKHTAKGFAAIFEECDADKERKAEEQKQKESSMPPGIQEPGSTGVIYVVDRATSNGFSYENPEWANFGQGAPEVGPIPNASGHPMTIEIDRFGEAVNEYAPTTGVKELRQAVADLYNKTYREGKKSQYSYENVCIVPGGRAGLSRIAAVIGDVYCAYQVPEYTAYSQMLEVFRRLIPVPTVLRAENGYKMDLKTLKREIEDMGISVVVASNPRNPTGQVIMGKELEDLVALSRDGTTLILDEFYSWYQYELAPGETVSAAQYIDDVDQDPVILVDGLTKNWRLPGWRCCWVIGPKPFVKALGQSGSFLDGGASHVLQMAAIPLLEYERVKQDRIALQAHFKSKRDYVLERLDKMGLTVKITPKATFYIWLDLSDLPEPLNSGLTFFEECLKEKVIVVPGIFFDISPSHRRNLFNSPAHHFVRLSFGPPLEQLKKGLDGIERILEKASDHLERHDTLDNSTFGTGLKETLNNVEAVLENNTRELAKLATK